MPLQLQDLPPAEATRLGSLAAIYDAAFQSMLDRTIAFDLDDVDAIFRQLRQLQRRRWPAGASLVDAIGAHACDAIAALERGDGAPAAAALAAHAAAVARLRSQLALAASERTAA